MSVTHYYKTAPNHFGVRTSKLTKASGGVRLRHEVINAATRQYEHLQLDLGVRRRQAASEATLYRHASTWGLSNKKEIKTMG